jgi:MFS transporter, Spinster family, sphingosine-1-phosphate transporter
VNKRVAYYGLTIVTLLNFFNYIDRYVIAAVLPRMQAELNLTNQQAGLLATAFLVAYFLTSPVFGALGDRLSRTRLMAFGVSAWSIATAATGVMRNFIQLMTARSFVGIGEAAYGTISPALLSDYFPREKRGRAFAVFYVAIPVGAAAGYLAGGLIEPALGWRAAFYVVGIPGIVLAMLALTVWDPPRGAAEETNSSTVQPVFVTLRSFVRNFAYGGTVLGYAAYTFAVSGLAFWMPAYLERVRGMDLAHANLTVASITVVAGLVGTFVGGYLGDFLSTKMNHGQLWICALSSFAAIIPTWLALTVASARGYTAWLFIAELLLFLSTGPVNVVIVNVVPVHARSMAMAVSIFTIHLLGDAISPPIIGALADMSGLARAVLIVPLTIALSGVLWLVTGLGTSDTPPQLSR